MLAKGEAYQTEPSANSLVVVEAPSGEDGDAKRRGPEPGQPMLRRHSLDVATVELAAGLRTVGVRLPDKVVEALARRAVRAYVKTDREATLKVDKRIAPMTVGLSEMQIDEIRQFPHCAPQVVRNRMRSARNLMGNQDARWVCDTKSGKTVVTRLPDGARVTRNLFLNEKAKWLVGLTPQMGYVLAPVFKHRRQLGTNTKVTARKILGDPNAEWQAFTRPNGVYVKRVR